MALTFDHHPAPTIEVRIQQVPDRVVIDGTPMVYYELHISNLINEPIHITAVEVIDDIHSVVVTKFNKDVLAGRVGRIADTKVDHGNLVISGQSSLVIYLEYAFSSSSKSKQITHQVYFETQQGDERKSHSVQMATFTLSEKLPFVLGAPLRSGIWAAVYNPSWQRGHRRVIFTVNGKQFIPGRFAIDFIKLDEQGRYANGDDNVVANWYGYNHDVLAVADGVVVSTRTDFPESATLQAHPTYRADQATGNYIAIDLGDNRFAFYEHLKPNSILVVPGQRVKKGDKIAALGFTGQSTGPHLHFHIANLNSPLGAEGIPFVFEHFTHVGTYADFDKFGKELWIPAHQNIKLLKNERPASNSVIRF